MDNTTATGITAAKWSDALNEKAIAVTFIGIFIVGLIGNSVVIYILFRKRRSWNITTTYLFNLSVADAIFVCTLPLWAQTYLSRMEWNFGVFLCKFVGTVTSLNMYASIFFLTAMSVDRWIAVVHATTINTTRSSVVARTMCVVVWMLAFLVSIPRLLFTDARPEKSDTNSTTTVSYNMSSPPPPERIVYRCGYMLPPPNKRMLMGLSEFMQAAFGFAIPMIIICACYLCIVRTVRKKLISKRVKKERVAILAGIIITAFFVCWVPLQLVTLYSALAGWWRMFPFDENWYWKLHPAFVCLAYANSCINPFIYAFTATNFKKNVKEVCGSNMNRCTEVGTYKMTLPKRDTMSPLSPKRTKELDTKTPFLKSSPARKTDKNSTEKRISGESSSDDIYEHFQPQGRDPKGDIGARGPPECQHLAVQDTTSGIYYEYFSSPPVLCRQPDQSRTCARRSDVINHNDQPEISSGLGRENSIQEESNETEV